MHILCYIFAAICVISGLVLGVQASPDPSLEYSAPALYDSLRGVQAYWVVAGILSAILVATLGRISLLLERVVGNTAGAVATGGPIEIRAAPRAETARRTATPTAKGVPLDNWEALVKYDPDVQAAINNLRDLGDAAIEELRMAHQQVNDPSKLEHISKIIRATHTKRREFLDKVDRAISNKKMLNETLSDFDLCAHFVSVPMNKADTREKIKPGRETEAAWPKWAYIEIRNKQDNKKAKVIYSENLLRQYLISLADPTFQRS